MSWFKRKNFQEYENILIIGNDDFIKRTIDALNLLKDRDNVNYRRVTKYVNKIIQSKRSGIAIMSKVFKVGDKTSLKSSLEWYASCIVHDAFHSMLSHRFKVPHRYIARWALSPCTKLAKRHEEICIRAQTRSLKKIGGSNHEISHLSTVVGSEYWKEIDRDW
jgi:hypothetical protein